MRGGYVSGDGACGDGMFIVQTTCRALYRSIVEDGRVWSHGCGEQSHLWGNQGLFTGAYWVEGQRFIYCIGKEEMRYY